MKEKNMTSSKKPKSLWNRDPIYKPNYGHKKSLLPPTHVRHVILYDNFNEQRLLYNRLAGLRRHFDWQQHNDNHHKTSFVIRQTIQQLVLQKKGVGVRFLPQEVVDAHQSMARAEIHSLFYTAGKGMPMSKRIQRTQMEQETEFILEDFNTKVRSARQRKKNGQMTHQAEATSSLSAENDTVAKQQATNQQKPVPKAEGQPTNHNKHYRKGRSIVDEIAATVTERANKTKQQFNKSTTSLSQPVFAARCSTKFQFLGSRARTEDARFHNLAESLTPRDEDQPPHSDTYSINAKMQESAKTTACSFSRPKYIPIQQRHLDKDRIITAVNNAIKKGQEVNAINSFYSSQDLPEE